MVGPGRWKFGVVLAGCCGWLVGCSLLTDFSDPKPTGEFQVNEVSSYAQKDPRVAMGADGRFVVVWTSYVTGANPDISVRFYDAEGQATVEFTANTITDGVQEKPDVALDADGNFVVVWSGVNQESITSFDIYARRFDHSGNPVDTPEFLVHEPDDTQQHSPRVAMHSGYGFVVAWIDEEYGDPYYYAVRARRFDTDVVPMDTELVVSGPDVERRRECDIALSDTNGDFMVAWSQDPSTAGNDYDVHGLRFAGFGSIPGPPLVVSTNNLSNQAWPSVAMGQSGNAIIAWVTMHLDDLVTAAIRLYDASGTPGDEIALDTDTVKAMRINVAMDDSGRFLAVYAAEDIDLYGIYLRWFDADGSPIGGKQLVNFFTAGMQMDPAVAMAPDGRFVVVWSSNALDGGRDGIFGRRYTSDGKPIRTF